MTRETPNEEEYLATNEPRINNKNGQKQVFDVRTCLLLWLRGCAGRPWEEDAGAVALALGAGRGEEHGAHAGGSGVSGSGRRALQLRLQQRRERRRAQVDGCCSASAAAGSFRRRVATYAPSRGRVELPLPLLLEELLLFEEMKLQNKSGRT
jgi:hypothetical protein